MCACTDATIDSHEFKYVSVCVCVCVRPVPFLSAGWLGVTLSLSTSLPAPLDPVAISNQPLLCCSQLLSNHCDCVHEWTWAGVLHFCACVCARMPSCLHLSLVAPWLNAFVLIIGSNAASLLLIHSQFIHVFRQMFPDSLLSTVPEENMHISDLTCWTENTHGAEGSGQHKIINRCWVGLFTTFELHSKQQPPFSACLEINTLISD